MSNTHLTNLLSQLRALPRETEWVEFKHNNSDPNEIGEYISALANAAAISHKTYAYLVWGVRDEDHEVVGTSFDPYSQRKGGEQLESWLSHMLVPDVAFRFFTFSVEGDKQIVILKIPRATHCPIRFNGEESIRVGSYKKKLKNFPERERRLWRVFDEIPFENGIAAEHVDEEDVLRLLDHTSYFDLLESPLPHNRSGILEALEGDRLIHRNDAGKWNISNLGAILFSKRLDRFDFMQRKATRVIQYAGNNRTKVLREQEGVKGYACGFEGMVQYVDSLLPVSEVITGALRKTVSVFPTLAVRELVGNALIHQDFFVTGSGPMVEIFGDRIEVTSPGEPLVDTRRFIDTPPRSRNETLAALMRRLGICEERGSGIDKVVSLVEAYQLPAPLFEAPAGFTRAVLFSHRDFRYMDRDDRIRACYLHACLRYVVREPMTNRSIRERFGVAEQNSSMISRLLNDAVAANVIALADPDAGTRARSYLPFWAAPERLTTQDG